MVFQGENEDNFIIIDGSSYLYRAFYALPNLKTSTGLNSGAIHGFANMLNRIISEYKPKYLLMVFALAGDSTITRDLPMLPYTSCHLFHCSG